VEQVKSILRGRKEQKRSLLQPGMGAIPHGRGTTFRVWAPHAGSVSVIGTFNDWDPGAHPLTLEENGFWAADVPDAFPGDEYKYHIVNGEHAFERIDPYAREVTNSVGNAVIFDRSFDWGDDVFTMPPWNELVIYELHIGTFTRGEGGCPGTFHTAMEKLPYLRDLGINAVELMPIAEFAGDHGWGYAPSVPFAVESAYGGPRAFKEFVQAAHEHGIAVILDVVYNHFGPSDLPLWRFDGWYENDLGGIYFYNDWRAQTPWGHTRPDYGRWEVRQYIRDNALMWLEEYRVDGLRWDMTSYLRQVDGQPSNPNGQFPEAWEMMRWINREIRDRFPWKITIAEEFRNDPAITREVDRGGAGFGSQWDDHFVHPVRELLITPDDEARDMLKLRDAILHRFGGDAFHRVIYTESHDEVANGRARVIEETAPDDAHGWHAKKRSTLGAALVFTAPGIPMIFHGQEFLTDGWFEEHNYLPWHQVDDFPGVVRLYRDLIALRRNLHGVSRGLTGQNVDVHHVNDTGKVLAFHRWAGGGAGDSVIVVMNAANRTVHDYPIGFPAGGVWKVRFDSHSHYYGRQYQGQVTTDVEAIDGECDGLPYHAAVSVAPYSAIILSQEP
jgi:1,4-alpha-glucan branching enzyme